MKRTNDRLYESKDSREILKGSVFSLGVPLCVVENEVEVEDRLKKLRSFGGGDGYCMSAQLRDRLDWGLKAFSIVCNGLIPVCKCRCR
jgi:hypothetical protein